MNALAIIETPEYQSAFVEHLSHGEGHFVPYDKQDEVKSDFYFHTSHPKDTLHDAIIRRSRCFFVSSTGMLCLFSDETALQGGIVLFVDSESCIMPVGTTPFNLIHQLNGGLLELDGVANVDGFIQSCERNFGPIDWQEEPALIAAYLSYVDN